MSGVKKRVILAMAFEDCGLGSFDFDITPEETASALRKLEAMLAEWRDGWGVDLGYAFSTTGQGLPEDDSGLPMAANGVVAQHLALRIKPGLGETLSPDVKAAMARSWAILLASYARVPSMTLRPGTPLGVRQGRRDINDLTPVIEGQTVVVQ